MSKHGIFQAYEVERRPRKRWRWDPRSDFVKAADRRCKWEETVNAELFRLQGTERKAHDRECYRQWLQWLTGERPPEMLFDCRRLETAMIAWPKVAEPAGMPFGTDVLARDEFFLLEEEDGETVGVFLIRGGTDHEQRLDFIAKGLRLWPMAWLETAALRFSTRLVLSYRGSEAYRADGRRATAARHYEEDREGIEIWLLELIPQNGLSCPPSACLSSFLQPR
jgi:hypothetical protein